MDDLGSVDALMNIDVVIKTNFQVIRKIGKGY